MIERSLKEQGRDRMLALLQLRQSNRARHQALVQQRDKSQHARLLHSQQLSTVQQARLEHSQLHIELNELSCAHAALLANFLTVEEAKTNLQEQLVESKQLVERISALKAEHHALQRTLQDRQAAHQKLTQEITTWLNKGHQLLL